MNMNKIYKFLAFLSALWLMFFAASCTPQGIGADEVVTSTMADGEPFTTTINGFADDVVVSDLQLRSGGIESLDQITSLRLLVFDKDQKFLYSTDAILGGSTAAPDGDDNYLPDRKKNGITDMKTFNVTLYQSSEVRYIHFIANYDWVGYKQDVFLEGVSAGDMIPKLTTQNKAADGNNPTTAFNPMWSMVKVDGLNKDTFNGKVVKLLRNYAKFSIELDPFVKGYKLDKFILCNVPNKGTVAPFSTSGYLFDFPYPPESATTPTDAVIFPNNTTAHMIPVMDGTVPRTFKAFEFPNTTHQKSFVIFSAIKEGSTTPRYYKVDLVNRKDEISVNDYFAILRNRHYRIVVKNITFDGFATMDEAIKSPAGNNVFASVELKDFGNVSDGQMTLTVDPIEKVIVRPYSNHIFNVSYTGVDSNGKTIDLGKRTDADFLQFYPSWDPATDPYLGALIQDDQKGFISVNAKAIPSDEIKEYFVEVVGVRYYSTDPNAPDNTKTPSVDGYSGATTPILRRINITVRKPFSFNASMSGTGGTRTVEFDIPEGITTQIIPFEILIDAPDLSPINTVDKNDLTLVFKDGKAYYKYIVSQPDQLNQRVKLSFNINNGSAETKKPVILTSELYIRDVIPAEGITLHSGTTSFYIKDFQTGGKDVYPIEDDVALAFTIDGVQYSRAQLFDKYGIAFTDPTAGKISYQMPQTTYDSLKAKSIKLTSTKTFGGASYGYMKYFSSATKTGAEWFNTTTPTHQLTTMRVLITGAIYHFNSSTGINIQRPSTTYYPIIQGTDNGSSFTPLASVTVANSYKTDDSGNAYYDYKIEINASNYRLPTYGLKFSYNGYATSYTDPLVLPWDRLKYNRTFLWWRR